MGSTQRIGARLGTAALAILAAGAGAVPALRAQRGQHRVVAGTKQARQLSARNSFRGTVGTHWDRTSGDKEKARGKRYYMQANYPDGSPRPAPVLQILSKRDHAEVEFLLRGVKTLENAKGVGPKFTRDDAIKSVLYG